MKLLVLVMAELQMTFVFTIGFTPGVFGVVRALQSMLVEFALQLAFLEFSTIGTGILRFKKKRRKKLHDTTGFKNS